MCVCGGGYTVQGGEWNALTICGQDIEQAQVIQPVFKDCFNSVTGYAGQYFVKSIRTVTTQDQSQ